MDAFFEKARFVRAFFVFGLWNLLAPYLRWRRLSACHGNACWLSCMPGWFHAVGWLNFGGLAVGLSIRQTGSAVSRCRVVMTGLRKQGLAYGGKTESWWWCRSGESSYPALSRALTKAVSRQALKLIFELIVSVFSWSQSCLIWRSPVILWMKVVCFL